MEPTRSWTTLVSAAGRGLFFAYTAGIGALAVCVVVARGPGIPDAVRPAAGAYWLMVALAGVAAIRPFVPPGRGRAAAIGPSLCFVFATLLLWGLGPAILTEVVAALGGALRHRSAAWRPALAAARSVLALAAAALVLRLAGTGRFGPAAGHVHPARGHGAGAALILLGAALAWFAVYHGLATLGAHLGSGDDPRRLAGPSTPADRLSAGALLLLAPVLAAASLVSTALIPFALLPLYALSRVTRLTAAQQRLVRLDPLTGLANRGALLAEIGTRLAGPPAGVDGGSPRLALLVLDLDGLRPVNAALGHEVGDRLLVEVGRRLRAVAHPADLVARLGGDEFAVLAGGPGSGDEAPGPAGGLAGRIAAALAEPVYLDGLPLDVDASVGVAVCPEHGADEATLLRHAEVAMYEAKTLGDPVAVYSPGSDHHTPERLSLLADLRHALEYRGSEEITFYYQPQVTLATGDVTGVEALLRWQHPRRGAVDPEQLMTVAEHSAVMRLVTWRVIDDVTAQLARWEADGIHLRASINVSVRDLHSGEIVERLAERLVQHGVSPAQLQLEITEGALMADPRRVLTTLQRLYRLGVALSLDDFGTGYSSLQHLRRLPVSEVKIDRSFVLGMTADHDDEVIVRSIIDLAGGLGLRVVAEGVEDEATWRLLAAAGCHTAQGWYYARPMPADQLVNWLGRYNPPAQGGEPARIPNTPATAKSDRF